MLTYMVSILHGSNFRFAEFQFFYHLMKLSLSLNFNVFFESRLVAFEIDFFHL